MNMRTRRLLANILFDSAIGNNVIHRLDASIELGPGLDAPGRMLELALKPARDSD
ncbi:hypothetical protein ACFYT3_07190 [Nocardia amikacinitolerans]|uniref:hypothetical protein n=1 Tax=Nocardia amikacinitolerans TaxID=756689 RepID=UPI00368BCC6C